MLTLADGQLAATSTVILTQGQASIGGAPQPQAWGQPVSLALYNTGATTETVLLKVLRYGQSTARTVCRAVLSQNQSADVSCLVLGPGDVLYGQTTTATTVDYTVFESVPGPFQIVTFDSSGQIKQTNGTSITGATVITSSSADAFDVGPNGSTNPTLQIDGSTASAATGVKVKSAAAASGVAISAVSSGTNENMTIDAKGSGDLILQATATGVVKFGGAAVPNADDGDALGSAALRWADLFLAEGGVINWDNGDVTITQTNNVLAVAGTTSTTFDGQVNPATNDAASLGTTSLGWADLHLATGGVINWANGEVSITETDANTLTFAGTTLISFGATTLNATGTRIVTSYHTNLVSTNAVTVDSSETVKRDITDYDGDALAAIRGMRVATYRHNDHLDNGVRKLGIIAESVREPMAIDRVDNGKDGHYPGINTYALAAIHTRAIQQLSDEVRKLKGQAA